jgi:ubiquinone/menaquinone biosynthesis C-methylase UbiE
MIVDESSDVPLSPDAGRQVKSAHRGMWALGDYQRFAAATVWQLGPVLVKACGISTGQRVLDVAAGTGNVAIRAAQTGATVVASDLTPENFESGRRVAAAEGVRLEWREADAEALPFDDGEFDVVTSCFGAIFAPDHRAVARELLRVCRPGGTIGMINFTPNGTGGEFFKVLARYTPPLPAGALPAVLWGDEKHVRKLFGKGVSSLEMSRREYVEAAASPRDYCDLFQQTFGPLVAIRAGMAGRPEELAALDRDFVEFIGRSNRGTPDGPLRIPYEYLLVVARKALDERESARKSP